ncbi:cell growth regulator with EF hand domain protein 1 [Cinclus cinclus]|uniref:cell growth regulator with EF hand domain protein 1 n=1 Tax=Cinclus cinclus TaxID=127875 RepID=UPI002E0D39D9
MGPSCCAYAHQFRGAGSRLPLALPRDVGLNPGSPRAGQGRTGAGGAAPGSGGRAETCRLRGPGAGRAAPTRERCWVSGYRGHRRYWVCWVSGYRGDALPGQPQPIPHALRSQRSPSRSRSPRPFPSTGAPRALPSPPPTPCSRPAAAPGVGMRKPLVMLILLLLLGPVAWAAPRAGTKRPGPAMATLVDPYPDPLSPESPALLLLWSAVRSLGPPEQDVKAMTREQALLYLFVLHDHDRSRHLDGLELLQLLGTVLAQAGGQPDPDMVAAMVDQALARQDLNGDGLLDPFELLDPPEVLLPGQDQGPPGQPPLEQQAGVGAVPGRGTEMPRQDLGLRNLGQAPTEAGDPQSGAPEDGAPKVESLEVESPSAEALEAEVIPEAKAPSSDAAEEEEAPEAEAPEEQAAPAWRDHGEG